MPVTFSKNSITPSLSNKYNKFNDILHSHTNWYFLRAFQKPECLSNHKFKIKKMNLNERNELKQ